MLRPMTVSKQLQVVDTSFCPQTIDACWEFANELPCMTLNIYRNYSCQLIVEPTNGMLSLYGETV